MTGFCPDLGMAGSFLSFYPGLNASSSKSSIFLCHIEATPQSLPAIFTGFIFVMFHTTRHIFIISRCSLLPLEHKLCPGRPYIGFSNWIPQTQQRQRTRKKLPVKRACLSPWGILARLLHFSELSIVCLGWWR
jgi:hypothetical protein